jgi:hypothetical protein
MSVVDVLICSQVHGCSAAPHLVVNCSAHFRKHCTLVSGHNAPGHNLPVKIPVEIPLPYNSSSEFWSWVISGNLLGLRLVRITVRASFRVRVANQVNATLTRYISHAVAYPRRGHFPPEFGEEGTPCVCSPQILLNDSCGHTFGQIQSDKIFSHF